MSALICDFVISTGTSGGVVVRQTDQGVARTRLTVGEAWSWNIVDDLIGL